MLLLQYRFYMFTLVPHVAPVHLSGATASKVILNFVFFLKRYDNVIVLQVMNLSIQFYMYMTARRPEKQEVKTGIMLFLIFAHGLNPCVMPHCSDKYSLNPCVRS